MDRAAPLGRPWQLGPVQVEYNMPERFGLSYTGADNAEHRPVMIHRALMGSYERFIGILLEHLEGELPVWLTPVQAIVLPISDRHLDYGHHCARHRRVGIAAAVGTRRPRAHLRRVVHRAHMDGVGHLRGRGAQLRSLALRW